MCRETDEQYEVGVIEKSNTLIVAEIIAEQTGADLFSIESTESYPTTYEGLFEKSREEENNPPQIAGSVENMDDYDAAQGAVTDWLSDLIPVTSGEGGNDMVNFDFSVFKNVELIGADLSAMNDEQLSVLYQQARYCQAMTDADTDTLRELVSEDAVFTHMSGRQQTREEYFDDIDKGRLRYFTIGIDSPVIKVDGELAQVTYTSVLNANAYGARGTYRMSGTHWFEKQDGNWVSINDPN